MMLIRVSNHTQINAYLIAESALKTSVEVAKRSPRSPNGLEETGVVPEPDRWRGSALAVLPAYTISILLIPSLATSST